MESIKSELFEKFKFDQIRHPEYVRGGSYACTVYNNAGKETGHDTFNHVDSGTNNTYKEDGVYKFFCTDLSMAAGSIDPNFEGLITPTANTRFEGIRGFKPPKRF